VAASFPQAYMKELAPTCENLRLKRDIQPNNAALKLAPTCENLRLKRDIQPYNAALKLAENLRLETQGSVANGAKKSLPIFHKRRRKRKKPYLITTFLTISSGMPLIGESNPRWHKSNRCRLLYP